MYISLFSRRNINRLTSFIPLLFLFLVFFFIKHFIYTIVHGLISVYKHCCRKSFLFFSAMFVDTEDLFWVTFNFWTVYILNSWTVGCNNWRTFYLKKLSFQIITYSIMLMNAVELILKKSQMDVIVKLIQLYLDFFSFQESFKTSEVLHIILRAWNSQPQLVLQIHVHVKIYGHSGINLYLYLLWF